MAFQDYYIPSGFAFFDEFPRLGLKPHCKTNLQLYLFREEDQWQVVPAIKASLKHFLVESHKRKSPDGVTSPHGSLTSNESFT